jgi:hypothetical protein
MTVREPRKHPLTGTWLVLCAVVFASCLAAASEKASSSRACPDLGSPTNFDYLVLASIADSPRFLAMAGYRSIAMQRAEPAPDAELTTIVTN